MNLKNEKCVLIFAPFNTKSSLIIKDLLNLNLRLRIVTDNLKGFKSEFFEVWEKFESVNQLEWNHQNFTKQKEKVFGEKNGKFPDYFIFIKTSKSDRNLFLLEMELVNFVKIQKHIKKFIYVQVNNKYRNLNAYSKFNTKSTLDDLEYQNSLEKIYHYNLEAAIRQSGINYLIIKNLEIQANSSVFSDEHMTFTSISDFMLNNRLNLVNYKNFKELIQKVLDGKIFIDDSTYLLEKSSFDTLIKYSTPQFFYDFFNFIYKDRYLRKITHDTNLIREDRIRLSEVSKVYSLICFGLSLKIFTYSLRFFINYYK